MRFLFPFSTIPQGSSVVIYGAGEVGYDFYRQLKTSDYAKLILWVDRQYEWFRKLNLPVDSPSELKSLRYDYIIVTAERKSVFELIYNDLIKLGVAQEKIIWKDDYSVHENIVFSYKDRKIKEEEKAAIKINPLELVNNNRLDIIIRYLYAKDILADSNHAISRNLYLKFVKEQWEDQEPTDNFISAYFSEYTIKRGSRAFDSSFIDLVMSIKQNGFYKEQFVPIDRKGRLINGAHRVAAALACKVDIWCVKYPFEGLYYKCDKSSLEKMNFTIDEIELVIAELNSLILH